MFTQQKLLFQFTKAIVLVILLCFTFSYQAQGEEEVVDMAKIRAQFVMYIEELFDDLESAFENSEFAEMADLLGNNAILVTPQGRRIRGRGNLIRFWRNQKEEIGITDVKFYLEYHYVTEVADPIELDPIEDTINAIGHAIIDYHLNTINGGGTLTNRTGTLTLSAGHPWRCVWGR